VKLVARQTTKTVLEEEVARVGLRLLRLPMIYQKMKSKLRSSQALIVWDIEADDIPRNRARLVLEKLGDSDIDEDDMPDALKETLTDLLYLPEVSSFRF
jgi:hypothetical protein